MRQKGQKETDVKGGSRGLPQFPSFSQDQKKKDRVELSLSIVGLVCGSLSLSLHRNPSLFPPITSLSSNKTNRYVERLTCPVSPSYSVHKHVSSRK